MKPAFQQQYNNTLPEAPEQGGFECSRTTGNQSSCSMTQQAICLTKYNFGIIPHISLIKFRRYSRSSRNNKLIFCIVAGCLYHPLQIILNFLLTTTSQQRNNWLFIQPVTKSKFLKTLGISCLKQCTASTHGFPT